MYSQRECFTVREGRVLNRCIFDARIFFDLFELFEIRYLEQSELKRNVPSVKFCQAI